VTDLDGHGRWNLTVNTWCLMAEGVDLTGPHRLSVRSTDGSGAAVHQATADAQFGAPLRDDALPWTPGEIAGVGSEPSNKTSETRSDWHQVFVDAVDDGGTYGYLVLVPPGYDPAVPAPTVFSLHPWGGDNAWRTFASATGMATDVASRGWLQVVPQGNHHDPTLSSQAACYNGDCRPSFGCLVDQCYPDANWYTPVLHAITADLATRYTIEPSQVYVMGQGCGGSYAWCLALDHGDRVAGAVIVDGDGTPVDQQVMDPAGAGVPTDRPGRPNVLVVAGATASHWEPVAPGGPLVEPWCLQTTWIDGGTSRQWYRKYNADILDFLQEQRSP